MIFLYNKAAGRNKLGQNDRTDIKTTVIIPNYNGLRFMDKCMSALEKQTYTSFRVLIVDNGSTDGSAEYINELVAGERLLFPVEAVMLPENTGFSGAVNVGIKEAQTEYVVLLNNDTEAEPDYLKELIAPLESDSAKKIGAVSPMMIQLYNKELLDDAGDSYSLLGWGFQRGVGQSVDTPRFNEEKKIFSACAGACAYRKSALEKIKLPGDAAYFDPMHFAYLEDIDVSFRLRIHGYDVIYEPKSKIYHVGSGTSGSKYNAFKVRLAARNNVYLNYKNMPLIMLILNLPGIAVGVFIKQLFFIKIGFGKDYFKGFLEGIGNIKECRRHKTFFKAERFFTYIGIELMLLMNTFSYIRDFTVRQAAKLIKTKR